MKTLELHYPMIQSVIITVIFLETVHQIMFIPLIVWLLLWFLYYERSICPTCLDYRMALWVRIPYLDQTLSFLGNALKSLCLILLSKPDQLVHCSCNLNRILIVQQLLCSLVQSANLVE